MENQRTISQGSSFLWCTNEARCEVFDLQTILLFSYMIKSFSQQGFCTKPPLSEGSSNSEKVNVAKASRISREEFCHLFFLKAHDIVKEINHASVGNRRNVVMMNIVGKFIS